MANETEHLYVLADNGQTYFSLRLSVTPAMKARVVAREASEELVSGMATSLQWSRGSVTLVPIGVRVATHMRYTSADPIDMTFVESTILNEREGGVYRFDAITMMDDPISFAVAGITDLQAKYGCILLRTSSDLVSCQL